jgi:hypothetical protein
MNHSCYKCEHSVEDGRAFCQQCGAPVQVAAGSVGSAELPLFSADPRVVRVNPSALSPGIVWPVALRTCALAALIAAVVMALGLMVPLLAALGASFLAVNFYHRRNPAWSVTARSGAQLGAVCGIVFFGIASVLESLAVVLFHTGGDLRRKMLEALQQAASRTSDPEVQAAFDRLKTPEGIALMLTFGLLALFVVSIAAGGLAGALTGAFLGRRKRL